MIKTVSTLSFCLFCVCAFAQQSIEIKPNEMTLKGQGAENNDRIATDANGTTKPRRNQEINLIRYPTSQNFVSGTEATLDFTAGTFEKKNTTVSNVNLSNDTFLPEETGLYMFDLKINWTNVMDGWVTIGLVQVDYVYSNTVKMRSDEPYSIVFTGLVRLDAGIPTSVKITQATGSTKSATFSLVLGKL